MKSLLMVCLILLTSSAATAQPSYDLRPRFQFTLKPLPERSYSIQLNIALFASDAAPTCVGAKDLAEEICNLEGVDRVQFTRYGLKVWVGEAFDSATVLKNVIRAIERKTVQRQNSSQSQATQ